MFLLLTRFCIILWLSMAQLQAHESAQEAATSKAKTVAAALRTLTSVRKQLCAEDLFLHKLLTEVRDDLQHVIDDAEAEAISMSDDKFEAITEAALTFNHAVGYLEKAVQLFTVRGSIATSALCSHFVSLCNAFTEFHPWNVEELDQKLRKFESVMMRHRPRGAQVVGNNSKELFDTLRMFCYHLRQCLSRPEYFDFALADRFYNTCFVQPYRWVKRNKGLTAVATGLAAGLVYYFFIREKPVVLRIGNIEATVEKNRVLQDEKTGECAAISIVNALIAENSKARVPKEPISMDLIVGQAYDKLEELAAIAAALAQNDTLSELDRIAAQADHEQLTQRLRNIPQCCSAKYVKNGKIFTYRPAVMRDRGNPDLLYRFAVGDGTRKNLSDDEVATVAPTAQWLSGDEVEKLLHEPLVYNKIAELLGLSHGKITLLPDNKFKHELTDNIKVLATEEEEIESWGSAAHNCVHAIDNGQTQTAIVIQANQRNRVKGHAVVLRMEPKKGAATKVKVYDSLGSNSASETLSDSDLAKILDVLAQTPGEFKAKYEEKSCCRQSDEILDLIRSDGLLSGRPDNEKVVSALSKLCQQFNVPEVTQTARKVYSGTYQTLLAFAKEHIPLAVDGTRNFMGELESEDKGAKPRPARFTPVINLEAAPTLNDFIRQLRPEAVQQAGNPA